MIPEEAFVEILKELERKPLPTNYYRKKAGEGRSQCLGVVNRRCLPPDYSRQCWLRPLLYKHLLDFGAKYVTDISWNAITVNVNYKAAAHRDKGNIGLSYLVACGDYQGGALQMMEGDLSGSYNIRHTPLIADFSTTLHSVAPWTGHRVSLVFYQLRNTPSLPPPSVVHQEGKWLFKRGEEVITSGLPHPLRNRKKK